MGQNNSTDTAHMEMMMRIMMRMMMVMRMEVTINIKLAVTMMSDTPLKCCTDC